MLIFYTLVLIAIVQNRYAAIINKREKKNKAKNWTIKSRKVKQYNNNNNENKTTEKATKAVAFIKLHLFTRHGMQFILSMMIICGLDWNDFLVLWLCNFPSLLCVCVAPLLIRRWMCLLEAFKKYLEIHTSVCLGLSWHWQDFEYKVCTIRARKSAFLSHSHHTHEKKSV